MKFTLVILLATLAVGLVVSQVDALECWVCGEGRPCNANEKGTIRDDCVECIITKGSGNDNQYSRTCNDFAEFGNKCEFKNGVYSCGCNTNFCNEKLIEEAPIITCYECQSCQVGDLKDSLIKTGCVSCSTRTSGAGNSRQCNTQHAKSDNCPVADPDKPSYCVCDTDICNNEEYGVSYEVNKASRHDVFDIVSRRLLIGGVMTAMLLGLARLF